MRTFIVLLLLAAPLAAQELSPPEPPLNPPRYHVQQGGIVVVPLDPARCYGLTLEAMGRAWRCEKDGRLLVGTPCDQPAGQYDLTARTTEESEVLATLSVSEVEFDRDEKRKRARPPAATQKRKTERAEIEDALTSGESKHPMMSLRTPWQAPLAVMETSGDTYGMFRDNVVYRGKGKKRKVVDKWTTRHPGVDLRAKTGTVVYSPGYGVVVHAAKTSSEGHMVILYHGSSVYTLHMHLSRIKVHEGQYVEPGEPIGSAGATGAANGPHLHYATKVGGAYVDPEKFIETLNSEWH